MKFLYVPWRSKYVKKIHDSKKHDHSIEHCPFCIQINEHNDEKNFILARYKYNFVILNLFPYNTGHILILPFRHIKNLHEMTEQEHIEFIKLTSLSTKILEENLNSQGINIGINLGKAAGAGIPSHMHMHIIPRWPGDTNFLPIIAKTKTISLDLNDVYNNLKPSFEKIKQEMT